MLTARLLTLSSRRCFGHLLQVTNINVMSHYLIEIKRKCFFLSSHTFSKLLTISSLFLDNESEKKEKSITKNSSKHCTTSAHKHTHIYIHAQCSFVFLSDCFVVLQSTETLNEMTDLETNEPSLIQPQPFISETQLEDFINEEEMLDDDEDDDFASFDS